MIRPLTIALGISALLAVGFNGRADPITYDFSGTFNQPTNGSDQFSGAFTINSNPTPNPDAPPWDSGGVFENGPDVSLTITLGSQTFHYSNTYQNPNNATFDGFVVYPPQIPENPTSLPYVEYQIGGPWASNDPFPLSLTMIRTGTALQLQDLAALNSPSFTSALSVSNDRDDPFQFSYGLLTSIELVSTPEPSTLLIFVFLGIAARALRSGRGK